MPAWSSVVIPVSTGAFSVAMLSAFSKIIPGFPPADSRTIRRQQKADYLKAVTLAAGKNPPKPLTASTRRAK